MCEQLDGGSNDRGCFGIKVGVRVDTAKLTNDSK